MLDRLKEPENVGVVVLAAVAQREEPRKRHAAYAVGIYVAIAICVWFIPGLAIAAAISGAWFGLGWTAAALSLWIAGAVALLKGVRRKVGDDRKNDLARATGRFLQERTRRGVFGKPVDGHRPLAWLTEEGIFWQWGARASFLGYDTFSVEAPEPDIHRVVLWRTPPWRAAGSLCSGTFLSLHLLGALAAVGALALGITTIGARCDVVLLGVLLAGYVLTFAAIVRDFLRPPRKNRLSGRVAVQELLVNARHYSRSDIVDLMLRHLPAEESARE